MGNSALGKTIRYCNSKNYFVSIKLGRIINGSVMNCVGKIVFMTKKSARYVGPINCGLPTQFVMEFY